MESRKLSLEVHGFADRSAGVNARGLPAAVSFGYNLGAISRCHSSHVGHALGNGLRAGELTALRWDQIDLAQGLLHIKRRKSGNPSTHPLHGPELRALRRLQRDYPDCPYVFTSERKGPLTDSAVRKLVARAGKTAGLGFPVHPHMLRHATGYKLANEGQDTRAIQCYLGHRNIGHTVRYTELSPERFRDF